jgi:hypothetical protein
MLACTRLSIAYFIVFAITGICGKAWAQEDSIENDLFLFDVGVEDTEESDDYQCAVQPSDYNYSHEELLLRLEKIQLSEEQSVHYEVVISTFFDCQHGAELVAMVSRDGGFPKIRYRDLRTTLCEYFSEEVLWELGEMQDLQGWISVGPIPFPNTSFYCNVILRLKCG